jgi:DNA replication and repair protein RecF
VHLKNLNLHNFRNIQELNLDFSSHIVAFKGLNGQGKTNIAESIYFLSKGKSFRTSDHNHLVRNESSDGTRVFGEIFSDDTNKELEIKILNDQKIHTLNQKKLNGLKIFKNFPVILFSPESLSAIKDGPEVRRNLIDETLILENESNISVIQNFRKILKTKNHVLRQFKQGRLNQAQAKDLLMGINPVFYNHATELTNLRISLLKNIHNLNQQSLTEITGKNVDIAVNYVTKIESEKAAEFDPNTLRKDLDENVAVEMSSGTSLYGPHKHDVVFEYSGIDSRFYCSQGQQRALILAFKFSQILYHHAIYGYYPILILDDVLSEFDREKRSFLIQFLNKNEAQTFLTTTEIDEELSHLDISVLSVKNGSVIF